MTPTNLHETLHLTRHETLRGGQAWSRRLARHQRLRLRDVEGRACVSALFYNARDPIERYNMPDTLKAQFTAFLTTGRVLYSDMGRILCSIVADDCGWHDTISGIGGAEASRARFGEGSYQALRNDFHRNGRDNLLVALGKHGLGKRDIVSNVNFFVRVTVDETALSPGHPATAPRRLRRAAVRDGHAGGAVQHAAPARSRAPNTSRRRSSCRSARGRPRPKTIPAGCRGRKTGAASSSPTPTPRRWQAHDEQLPHDGERARSGCRRRRRHVAGGAGLDAGTGAGDVFRIVDLEGNQAVDTLFFNGRDIDERYSATETIRAQGNIYLTTGTRLMSSEGRSLLTIVADTCGRHDTLGGACSAESNQVRYALDKQHMHNCRDSFLLALARYGHGMGKRDLPNNINFFMNVPVTPSGELTFATAFPGRVGTSRCGPTGTCWS
jgi:urea carboxylase-associated protein 1